MARITILGGTGYAGGYLVDAAAAKGHSVVAYSRNLPETPVDGVEYRIGDVTDDAVLESAVSDTDVVVSALSPRGKLEGAGRLRGIEKTLAGLARSRGVRFGVVGGAGSLLTTPDGPIVADDEGFPAEIKPEADEMTSVLDDLRAGDQTLDWFYVSPPTGFGPWAPGEATGSYRLGGDVVLVDGDGESAISGADLADAVVSEIETPAHPRARFTVAY